MEKDNEGLRYKKNSSHNPFVNIERLTANSYQTEERVRPLPAGDWEESVKNHFLPEEGDYREYYRVR